MSKLGVAIVGMDHWYWAFDLAQQAAEGANTRLVAVADAALERAEAATKRSGGEALTDLRAAIEHPDVQIVAITTSTDQAPELIKQAAAAGKHILGVKPFALNLADADAIVAAVQSAGIQYFPLESAWRLAASHSRNKQWVEQGRIGTAIRYTHTMNSSLPMAWPGSSESGWWLDPERVPGGGWLDHAIYALDFARWMFAAEPSSVTGVAGAIRYPELPLEDYGHATYGFPGGKIASIEDTWTADRGKGFSRNEIIGTTGAICDDSSTLGRVAVRGDFGHDGWVTLDPARVGTTTIDHIAAAVRGESQLIANVEDARANLAGCIAFYQQAVAIRGEG
jgi:predicted dehydrogenase